MKNKNIMFAAVLLFAVALSLVPTVNASGHFATNYTNASLTGVYGYSSYGEHLGPSNPNNNTTNVPADSVGVFEPQFPAAVNDGEGRRVVTAVAEPLHRARAIRVHYVGSDDRVIGRATMNDDAAYVRGIVKLKRAKPVKPHNADGIDRSVCRVVRRVARS